jgi:hypothetical protein
MTDQELHAISAEILGMIESEIAVGRCPQPAWLVHAVVTSWRNPPSGPDADKWLLCGYGHVRTIVRQVVRSRRSDKDDDAQLVLEGFQRLHRWYIVPRGGEQTIVAVDRLTVEEALMIIEELNRSKRGLDIHIDEMQRYIDEVLLPRAAGSAGGAA